MFVATVRPLYADTDQMGVVNHAVALRWFEVARAEWLRRLGYTYREFEATGLMLPIYDLQIRYHRPAYYDQLLGLSAQVVRLGAVRVHFHYTVADHESGELLVEGGTHHAVVGKDGRPQRLGNNLRQLLQRGVDEQLAASAAKT
jgi:acyl-CoA thioester hydrolase